MLRRLEVVRWSIWRGGNGLSVDAHAALTVAGHAIASLEGMQQRGRPRHPGLDRLTANDFLETAQIQVAAGDVMRIVHEINRSREGENPFRISDTLAGQLLGLLRHERTGLGITTMEAVDEPAAQRKARVAAEKRKRDALRRQAATDAKRAAAGKPPLNRSQPAVATQKEWEMLNMSRPKYYRLKKAGRLPIAIAETETSVSRTSSDAPSETPVSRASLHKGARRASLTPTDAAASGEAVIRTAPRALTLAEAETQILKRIGGGSIQKGEDLARRIDPLVIRYWSDLLRRGDMSRERFAAIDRMVRKVFGPDQSVRGAA